MGWSYISAALRWLHRRVMGWGLPSPFWHKSGWKPHSVDTLLSQLRFEPSFISPSSRRLFTTLPELQRLHHSRIYTMPIHIVLSAMMSVFRYIWWDTDRRDLQQICQIINTRRYYIQRQTVKKRKKKSLITHRNMGKRLREITVCRMMKSKWQTGVGMVCVGIWKQRGIRRGVTSGKVQNLYDNKM